MELNRKLNLVIPVEVEEGKTIYVHSMPIGAEAFESNYLVIARTFSDIHKQGLQATAAPRIAAVMLKNIAKNLGLWDGELGVEKSLFQEIRRLTNVVTPSATGWTTIPFEDARRRKVMSDDDLSEVENAIVFFIVASAMYRKKELAAALNFTSTLWGAQVVSSNVTEFAAGLPTSTETENTGAKATASSIPV